MYLIDQTLDSPDKNLAFDEALLLDTNTTKKQYLRFWESETPFVVLGLGNKYKEEVFDTKCKKDNIQIKRRCSGGGTILQGKGCLNYALVLNIPEKGDLASIKTTNCYIMKQNKIALSQELDNIEVKGFSDLTFNNLKFSGNAQRRLKNALLFHGTILYNYDLELISTYIKSPPKQPEYRKNRKHKDFICNLPLELKKIKTLLINQWQANQKNSYNFDAEINSLLETKYGKTDWHLKI